MFIYPRNIYREINMILRFILAEGGKTHQVGAPTLALDHITDGLLIKLPLGQHSDHQRTIFNQADCSMLKFTGCVCLTVNIGDFFQLQTAFQPNGLVDAPANEKHIMGIGVFCRKPLDSLLVFHRPRNLVRQCQQFGNVVTVLLLGNHPTHESELYRQAIYCDELCAVCLRRSLTS